MTEQLSLTGESRIVELTERQQFALEQIELGAALHERRGKHDTGVRCQWCATEGKQVASELRRKGLVVRRRSGLYESLRPRSERRPLEEGAGRVRGGSAPASSSSGDYDPETAQIPF